MTRDSRPRTLRDRVTHPVTEDDWELWRERRSPTARARDPITEDDWELWQAAQRSKPPPW